MKIAYIVNAFPLISETFILNQITGLIDLGNDVDIIAWNKNQDVLYHSDVKKYHLLSRTKYAPAIPKNPLKRILEATIFLWRNIFVDSFFLLKSFNIFRFGREAINLRLFYYCLPFIGKRYDILHCHFGPNGVIGSNLKKLGISGKLATTFHGYDIRYETELGRKIYKDLFLLGDIFIAASNGVKEKLLSYGLDECNIKVHYCGIDINRFTNIRHSYSKNSGIIRIITVARLVPEKGIKYGILAIGKLVGEFTDLHIEYLIVGDGPLKNDLEELSDDLGLNKFITFLGAKNQEQIIRILNDCDIFLLPSVEEAFGVVLLEAQAVGLPFVATDVGSVNNAVLNGRSGFLVPSRNVDLLFKDLSYLIRHQEIWSEMGMVGRKFVEENYDIHRLNKRLLDIFEAL